MSSVRIFVSRLLCASQLSSSFHLYLCVEVAVKFSEEVKPPAIHYLPLEGSSFLHRSLREMNTNTSHLTSRTSAAQAGVDHIIVPHALKFAGASHPARPGGLRCPVAALPTQLSAATEAPRAL